MKNAILSFFCLLCLNPLFSQQSNQTNSFLVSPIDSSNSDEVRQYTVAVPSAYNANTPTPLILNLHAYFESIAQYRASLSIDSIAEANNVIVVYPLGDTCAWNYKPLSFLPNSGIGWNAGIIGGDFDDVDFLSRVLDSVQASYNIDTNRIYCMGASNGAFMTIKLAAAIGNRFTAVANIIGFDSLRPNLAVPIVSILGTNDTISRYNGIPNIFPSWSSIRSNWFNVNACSASYAADTLPDLDPTDGSWVEKRSYNACGNRGTMIEYLIRNGGHNVPNTGVCTAPPIVCNALGSINNDIDPSVEIWNFFNSSVITSSKELQTEKKILNIYPNPANNLLYIQQEDQMDMRIQLMDLSGRIIMDYLSLANDRHSIDVSSLTNGIYLLRVEQGGEFITQKLQINH